MASIESNLIVNAITDYVKKLFQLDQGAMQLINMVVIKSVSQISLLFNDFDINECIKSELIQKAFALILGYRFYIFAFLCIMYSFTKKHQILNYIKPQTKSISHQPQKIHVIDNIKYYSIDISDIMHLIEIINKFMKIHPEFYNTSINKKMIKRDEKIYNIYNSKVLFDDKIHNKSGYITTRYSTETYGEKSYDSHHMILFIRETNDNNKQCYISQLENYVKHQISHGDYISLSYYKVLPTTLIDYQYYENNIDKWDNDIMDLKKSFFSIHKNYLFRILQNKINNTPVTDNGWNNMILHGPPGTGKSSFVFRIGVCLKMDIVSVDLSLYMDKKRELFALFHDKEFELPIDTKNKKKIGNKFIIILDEFDACVDKLMRIDSLIKYKDSLIQDSYSINKKRHTKKDNKQDSIKYTKKKKKSIQPVIDDLTDKEFNMHEYMIKEQLLENKNYESDESNETEYNRFKIPEKQKIQNDIIATTNELSSIIQQITDDNKSDILQLSDLLELFQGPIPIKNRMIIATTNNFDKIKNTLPALFRAGRLTPLKFDYLDWDTFKQLCLYYFDMIPVTEKEITKPTSEITELAQKNINDFDSFLDDVFN